MHGYAMRHGYEWETLDHREQVNLAEQAMFEPMLHGGTSVDALLDKMADLLIEANPTDETWGTSRAAQEGQAAAERTFGQATQRTARSDPPPSTISPDEPAA